MKMLVAIIILLLLGSSCRRLFEAPVPDRSWELFDSPAARPLANYTRAGLQGIYRLEAGSEQFGDLAAARWSYTANGTDTVYQLSFFCREQAAYFVCEGRRLDTAILLNGYWRKPVNTQTGRVRLSVTAGSAALLDSINNQPLITRLSGSFGYGEALPSLPLQMNFERPLPDDSQFDILAHRGGGRTADLLPASENSVEMIRLASQFGATGIEIDVRMTKDKVPVLFHDATLNERLVRKTGLVGPIENYTYDQLNTLVRLSGGERIPTLREALEAVVYLTPLRMVWLDTKFNGPLQSIRELQTEYLEKAATEGRQLRIYIGIPDEEVLANFMKLPGYQQVPSLCELEPEKALQINSAYWAPQWTGGLQREETEKMHAAGKKVVPWTLDIPENIEEFITRGSFDAILSNYPSAVAHYYYVTR